ncbi:hypothetical protein KUV41_12215 [Halomonas sp. DP8Y7-1]|uniref:hypothetical protein n=1 Tax=Halomonas sp. DP8Y7-1 TaxID=2859078 RepID=UPI001C958E3B|nr:hypothetical protein [Halomonas sp. DP8Y7-1]MBY6030118.1 hypothetical protein [Halomonas sp. DP8Y7-1]
MTRQGGRQMYYPITCTLCGHDQATLIPASASQHNDWDELRCVECDEFHATVADWEQRQTPDYLRFLNKSRSLMMAIRREQHGQHRSAVAQECST